MNSQPGIQPIPQPEISGGSSLSPVPCDLSPALDPQYRRLSVLDRILNLLHKNVDDAQHKYQQTLEEFATRCHELWQREKAQGNHQGKGFRQSLQAAGINVRRAYRAMKKFFPADFPTRPKSLKKQTIPALCPVHKAGVRSTGELIDGNEVLECKFALTPEDKAEFFEALKFVDRSQVWPLLLDAVKQAARQAQSLSGFPARAGFGLAGDVVEAISASPASAGFGLAHDGVEALSDSSPDEVEAAKPQTLSDNNQSSTPSEDNDNTPILDQHKEITDPPADSAAEGLERLTRLHDSLQLRERHNDLPGLAAMFTLEELQAKLDWVDACPGWRIGMCGATGLEFSRIFQLVPTDGSPPPQ